MTRKPMPKTSTKYATEDDLQNQKWECEDCGKLELKDRLFILGNREVCQECWDKDEIMIDHLGDDGKPEPVEPEDNPREDALSDIQKGL